MTGENARLDIPQLQLVQRQHVLFVFLLKSQSKGHYSVGTFREKTGYIQLSLFIYTDQNKPQMNFWGSNTANQL